MGEHKYRVIKYLPEEEVGKQDKEVSICFTVDNEEDLGCLCTFPHNDKAFLPLHKLGEGFDKGKIRSLAYLGAMVAIVNNSDLDVDQHLDGEYRYLFLPNDLPEWVRKSIDLGLGIQVVKKESTRET